MKTDPADHARFRVPVLVAVDKTLHGGVREVRECQVRILGLTKHADGVTGLLEHRTADASDLPGLGDSRCRRQPAGTRDYRSLAADVLPRLRGGGTIGHASPDLVDESCS